VGEGRDLGEVSLLFNSSLLSIVVALSFAFSQKSQEQVGLTLPSILGLTALALCSSSSIPTRGKDPSICNFHLKLDSYVAFFLSSPLLNNFSFPSEKSA
jgi:uncharacterized membrane protein YraQ (UPF0718 family)